MKGFVEGTKLSRATYALFRPARMVSIIAGEDSGLYYNYLLAGRTVRDI
jgi:hypothetical protein